MSRNLGALFQEESQALQQSQLFHLIEVELLTLALGTASAGATVISVDTVTEAHEGQYVKLDGIDGMRQIITVDGGLTTIELDEAIDVDVASTPIRLFLPMVESNYPVTFDGINYVEFPVQFSDISVNSDSTLDKASMSVANVSREIMYYVEKYDGLRNRTVTVKTVFQRFLDNLYSVDLQGEVTVTPNPEADPTAFAEDAFVIDSYTATESSVEFQLDPAIHLDVKLPHRRYTSDSCYWRYRDADTCGFDLEAFLTAQGGIEAGPYLTCNKSYTACQERENIERFGGFPGISGSRRVFL